jgi:hypothetical protein
MVYLSATLPPQTEPEIMSIMKTAVEDVHIFRAPTSRPNIEYSVIEYEEDEMGRGDIQAVYRLIEQKLDEYPSPAKIIVYSSSIATTQKLSEALDCHAYYRDVGDPRVKDEIRKEWECANGRVVIATNAFGLGIDRPDVRVVVHIGPIYQMRNYGQESGRAGRDGQRAQAIVLMPAGKQEALQKSCEQAQRQPVKIRGAMTEKEKRWIEQQKVDRFLSGGRCRRIYLDGEMDGRMDRVRCEEGEERCDVCQDSDGMVERMEAQRQAYVQEEREQDRSLDSGIDIPSSIRLPELPEPSPSSQDSIVGFDQGFTDITTADRHEFEAQQSQRQQQRLRIRDQNQREGHEVWDLEDRLDMWVGKCALCYVRKCQGSDVDIQHPFEECQDDMHELVAEEIKALEGIQFERFTGCFDCGVAQKICSRWEEVREGSRCFKRVEDGVCQYRGVVQPVVAAIMVAGPLEVVKQAVYARMKVEGIWGTGEQLSEEDIEEMKRGMLRWFGKRVKWGLMEASVLLQVFYWLTVGLEEWRRR